MKDWPTGFWQTRTGDAVHLVMLSRLPVTRETLTDVSTDAATAQ